MKKEEVKKTLEQFLALLEEMQAGKENGKHNNCVFGNTLSNIREIAFLNGINPGLLKVRKSWKSYFPE